MYLFSKSAELQALHNSCLKSMVYIKSWTQLSKIEKGLRQLKREQIPIIAEILKASSDELMTLWLADQIYDVVKDEKMANEAMQVAEKKINLKKRNK